MIECLVEAGAFDFTGWTKAQLLTSVDPIFQNAQKEQKEQARGELNFFSLIEEVGERFSKPPDIKPLPRMDVLRREKELLGFYLTGHPLDDVKEQMSHLACVSLDHLETLDQGAVCRVGFVIEAVQTKLTARTGRKFAILTIGDGNGRHELAIWSEQYERHCFLLVENQLIYAVLQMDKDENGGLRLRCHWLGDLSRVDETMIQECDLAYDKARMQAKMNQFRKKNHRQKKDKVASRGTEQKKGVAKMLKLKLNANLMRLSHVLELKKIFHRHTGKSEIQMEFWSGEKRVGTISIESTWGVELTAELKEQLEVLPGIVDILAEPR